MEVFTKPSAGGIIQRIIDGEKCILIQERFKDDLPLENGLIEIPGGKIREFENIFNCLRREVKEETGLDITEIEGEEDAIIIENHDYKTISYEPFMCTQNTEGYYPVMIEIFLCKAKGDLLAFTNETKNLRWISLKDLNDLLLDRKNDFYPMHYIALKKYIHIFLKY